MAASRPSRAFTLIELLVVIAIIGLLASIVMASLSSARTKAALAGGQQFASSIDNSLGAQTVGWWDMGECSGATAYDKSGYGNNATIPSTIWSSDTPFGSGCSLSFTGAAYGSLPTNPSLSINAPFTISLWVKGTTFGSGGWAIFFGGQGGDFGFGVNPSSAPKLHLTKISVIDAPNSNNALTPNVWHHAAVVYDGTTVSYYLDGQYDGGGAWSVTFASGTKYIGGTTAYSANLTGSIDNLRLFSSALTAAEIEKMYLAEAPAHEVAAK